MSDRIVSQPSTAQYRENWERIWGKKQDAQKSIAEMRELHERWPKHVYETVMRQLDEWAKRELKRKDEPS